jgi:hypothetical protein
LADQANDRKGEWVFKKSSEQGYYLGWEGCSGTSSSSQRDCHYVIAANIAVCP